MPSLDYHEDASSGMPGNRLFLDNDILYFGNANDFYMRWDGTDFDVVPLANNSIFKFGTGALGVDLWVYGATGTQYTWWDASSSEILLEGIALNIRDSDAGLAELNFGDADDMAMYWTSTGKFHLMPVAAGVAWEIGDATHGSDLKLFGTGSSYLEWDQSAAALTLADALILVKDYDAGVAEINFGDSSDIAMHYTSTGVFKTIPAAAGGAWEVGDATHGLDLKIFGTGSSYLEWDQSAAVLTLSDGMILIKDLDAGVGELNFGDGSDVAMHWTSTGKFYAIPAADDSAWELGDGTHSFDLKIYGTTGASFFEFDTSADALLFTGTEIGLYPVGAAAPATANVGVGALKMFTNTTGIVLVLNTTGTTWSSIHPT